MKVLHLFHSKRREGGVFLHVQNIVKEINQQSNIKASCFNLYEIRGVFFLNKKIINPISLPKKIKPHDIIHVHGIFSIAILMSIIVAIIYSKTIVCTPHYHPIRTLNHPKLAKIWLLIISGFLSKIEHFIALTSLEKVLLENEVTNKNYSEISIIPNGSRFKRSKYESVNKEIDLLFVGNTQKNKNLKVIFELEPFFVERNLTVGIVIEKESNNHGPFKFFNNLSDHELVNLYKISNNLIIPSTYEAFSLVAIEALCFNCRVIASNNVALGSLLNDKNDFFFVFNNINELKSYVDLFGSSSMNYSISKSVDVFLNKFKWEKVATRTIDVYNSLKSQYY